MVIYLSESVLQISNNGSYGIKIVVGCSLQNLEEDFADM